MTSRSMTRWSWRHLGRVVGVHLSTHDHDAVVAGVARLARCLVSGLYLERPEGEQ
jgi:hypothetical protein